MIVYVLDDCLREITKLNQPLLSGFSREQQSILMKNGLISAATQSCHNSALNFAAADCHVRCLSVSFSLSLSLSLSLSAPVKNYIQHLTVTCDASPN